MDLGVEELKVARLPWCDYVLPSIGRVEGTSHVFCAKIAWEGLDSTSKNNLETAVVVAATNTLRRFGEISDTQGIQ